MKYCQYCGTQIADEAKFCSNCGKAVWQAPDSEPSVNDEMKKNAEQQNLINKLSSRLKTNGIIWIVIASIQILVGLFGVWFTLIVGVLNIFSAITDIKNSKRILTNQNDIVKAYEPIVGSIITLVYNFFIGGIIGVLGSIYYLVSVRGFVMENKNQFLAMEDKATSPVYPSNISDASSIEAKVVLTEQEAINGVRKEVYVEGRPNPVCVNFPKNLKDGSTVLLRNMEISLPNGESVKKNVHVRVSIQNR